jgi:hypothetical protein
LTPGQRFFCLADGETFPLTTSDGKPATRAEWALKLMVLRESGADRLVFANEDGTKTCVLSLSGPRPEPEQLPGGIYPVLEDAETEAMREKYEGKSVWAYSGFSLDAVMPDPKLSVSVGFSGRTAPAKFRRLLRLRLPRPVILSAGQFGGYIGETETAFAAYDPLIVLLEPTGASGSVSASAVGGLSPEGEAMLQSPRKYALGYYAVFAGAWDLERGISRMSLTQASRGWSPTFRKAVLAGELRKGMTPEMVAWVQGWPSQYGTQAEVQRLDTWIYGDIPPYDVRVFFRNGRVTGWTEPVQLP